jgi:hypothetical protein
LANYPTAAHNPKTAKQPTTFNQIVQAQKIPKTAADPQQYYKSYPSWRFLRSQMAHPWGWHDLTQKELHYVREKLIAFEGRTWSDILVRSEKLNHPIAIDKLCKQARDRLSQLQVFVDEVVSLHLSSTERIIGIMENGAFSVLWWDPDHQVCPSRKKNT